MIHGSILHRVAITGIGIVSRLGNDIESVGKALRRGESGVVSDPEREKVVFRSPLTDAIRDFDARDHLPEKQRKTMTGFAVQAYVASTDAIRMSRLTIALDGMRETAGESGKGGTGS